MVVFEAGKDLKNSFVLVPAGRGGGKQVEG